MTGTYPATVSSYGLGYQLVHPGEQVRIVMARLHSGRDGLKGEIAVQCDRYAPLQGRVLTGITVNLTSAPARAGLVKMLTNKLRDVPWDEYVEQLFTHVVTEQRKGTPSVELGPAGSLPRREQPLYRLAPILQYGKPTVVFGPGGHGKSLLAKAVALSVAGGQVVVPGWQPQQAPVLVLDWETDAYDWDEDLRALALGADVAVPPGIHYRPMVDTLHGSTEDIPRQVREDGIGLLIVDSTEPAMGAANRENVDAATAANMLHDALRKIGTTTLLLDHVTGTGAEQDSSPRRPYGSVFKENRARNLFMLRKDEFGDRVLVNTKPNKGAALPAIGLRYEWADGRIRIATGAVASPELARHGGQREQVAALLATEGPMADREITTTLGLRRQSNVRTLLERHPDTFLRLPDGRLALVERS